MQRNHVTEELNTTVDVEPTVPSSCRLEGAISERAISERVKLGGWGAISEREGAISERVQKWSFSELMKCQLIKITIHFLFRTQ